jgi:hypothetical protein
VIYRYDRPSFSQPVNGGTSVGMTALIMVGMVAIELWMLTLLQSR